MRYVVVIFALATVMVLAGGVFPAGRGQDAPKGSQPHAPNSQPRPRALTPDEGRILATILTGSEADRVQSAKRLAQGPVPPAIVAALCEKALSADTQLHALDALEVVSPKLFDPVRKLTTLKTIGDRTTALEEIEKLGPAAAPALPVILSVADKTLDQLTAGKVDDDPFGGQIYLRAYKQSLFLVGTLGAGEERSFAMLVKHANFGLRAGKSELDPRLEAAMFDFSVLAFASSHRGAISAIGDLADSDPVLRGRAVTALVALLDTGSPVRQSAAAEALARCGIEAGRAIPELKKHRYAPSERTQLEVKSAVTEIEGRLAADKTAVGGAKFNDIVPLFAQTGDSPACRHALDLIRHKHPALFEPAVLLFGMRLDGVSDAAGERIKNAADSGRTAEMVERITAAGQAKAGSAELLLLLRASLARLQAGDPDPAFDRPPLLDAHRKAIDRLAGGNSAERTAHVAACVEEFKGAIAKCRPPGYLPRRDFETGLYPGQTISKKLVERAGAASADVLDQLLKEVQQIFTEETKLWPRMHNEYVMEMSVEVLTAFARSDRAYGKKVLPLVSTLAKRWQQGDLAVLMIPALAACGPDAQEALEELADIHNRMNQDVLRRAARQAIRELQDK